jgi:hypothetical protein
MYLLFVWRRTIFLTNPFGGQLEEEGPDNQDFLGPEMARARRERNRRRREEWLESRNNRSLTSPAPAAAAVPVIPTAADAATAASYAAVAAVSAGSYCAVTDKAVAAATATAPTPLPNKRPKVTVSTRASERLSVMANRRSIPQLDGCFSPSESSFEAFSPAPAQCAHPAPAPPDPASPATAPPPGYILCNICRLRHHDWVYSRCKHCKV